MLINVELLIILWIEIADWKILILLLKFLILIEISEFKFWFY